MWVESSVQVGDQSVGLCILRLDDVKRERTAAVFAWLTLDAIRSSTDDESTAWHEFVNDVLREHVTFSVPDERLEHLGRTWWSEAVSRALLEFVRQNELAPSINRHLQTLHASGRSDRAES
jgi:hypothetical protein